MARLHDSNGVLLGGLNAIVKNRLRTAPPEAGTESPTAETTRGMRIYDGNEIVPGLECSYRVHTYSSGSRFPSRSVDSLRHQCHNPLELPDERHHCDLCGGDFCTIHAEPAMHDCKHAPVPAKKR